MIKAYDSNPWQIIRQGAQFPLAISKTQFSLVISKTPFLLAISKAHSPLAISKAQLSLTMSKAQFSLALFSQKKPKIFNAWQRKNIMA